MRVGAVPRSAGPMEGWPAPCARGRFASGMALPGIAEKMATRPPGTPPWPHQGYCRRQSIIHSCSNRIAGLPLIAHSGVVVALRVSTVPKEDEYVINGLNALHLADRAALSSDKLRLLKLAESWLALLERIRRRKPKGRIAEHPFVKAKLGDPSRDP